MSGESVTCGGDPCRTGAVLVPQPSLCVPARSAARFIGGRAPPPPERAPAGPSACSGAEEVCPFRLRRRRGRAVRHRGCREPLAARCAGRRCRSGDGAPRQVLHLDAAQGSSIAGPLWADDRAFRTGHTAQCRMPICAIMPPSDAVGSARCLLSSAPCRVRMREHAASC